MVWRGLNMNAELTRRVSEILKTRDWLQLFRNTVPQVVIVGNDDKLHNVDTLVAARTATGTTNLRTTAIRPSQTWITALSLSIAGLATTTVSTAAIRAVRDGQTITLAIINIAASLAGEGQSNSIAHDFSHPIRVDENTNISLTTVQTANTFVNATVHIVTNKL